MIYYAIIDESNHVVGCGNADDDGLERLTVPAGCIAVRVTDPIYDLSVRRQYQGDQLVELGPMHVPSWVELRVAHYPPITDYLDAIVKGDQAAVEAYRAKCLAVKKKYPKP